MQEFNGDPVQSAAPPPLARNTLRTVVARLQGIWGYWAHLGSGMSSCLLPAHFMVRRCLAGSPIYRSKVAATPAVIQASGPLPSLCHESLSLWAVF